MIKSMTGFGRAEVVTEERRITVELKSVNHRYLDMNIRMPKNLIFLEGAVRNLLKTYMERGKVDVFITWEDYRLNQGSLKYHRELAAQYMTYFREISHEFDLDFDIRTSTLARFPDVFTMEEQSVDEEMIWNCLEQPLKEAAESFVQTRIREGDHLKKDILEKLEGLEKKVTLVQERSPEVVAAYRVKLEEKLHELLEDNRMDENRIAAEVVIFADKICNDEETVRLMSHITGMRKVLEEDRGVGRKLDFIAQEMNREANTILSKSSDLQVSNLSIDIKTEIEKIREQIQNIE